MKCSNCGSENESDAKFCSFCGAPIGKEAPPPLQSYELVCGIDGADSPMGNSGDDGGDSSSQILEEGAAEVSHSEQISIAGDNGKKKGNSIKTNLRFFLVSCLKYLGVVIVAFLAALVLQLVSVPNSFVNDWTVNQAIRYVSILVWLGIPVVVSLVVLACLGEERRAKVKGVFTKRAWVSKAGIALCLLASVAFVFWPCSHSNWINATCQHPKYCSVCGKEEGGLAGHQWVNATCQQAKHCCICGAEEGSKLEHEWEPATCTKPKTCKLCGATEGGLIDHTPGDWADGKPDYANATVKSERTCQVCGEVIESETKEVTSFVSDGAFSLPASDFIKRMNNAFSSISGCKLKADSGLLKDGITMSIDIKSSSSKVANGGFVKTGSKDAFLSLSMSGGEKMYREVLISCTSSSSAAEIVYALIQSCDPSMSSSEAYDVGTELLDGYKSLGKNKGMGQTTKNGIKYSLGQTSNTWIIGAEIV